MGTKAKIWLIASALIAALAVAVLAELRAPLPSTVREIVFVRDSRDDTIIVQSLPRMRAVRVRVGGIWPFYRYRTVQAAEWPAARAVHVPRAAGWPVGSMAMLETGSDGRALLLPITGGVNGNSRQ